MADEIEVIQVYDGYGNAPKPPPTPKPQLPPPSAMDEMANEMNLMRRTMADVKDEMDKARKAMRANVKPPDLQNVGGEYSAVAALVIISVIIVFGIALSYYVVNHDIVNAWIVRNMGPRH